MTECSRCHGHGILGGRLSGEYAGPWRWCDCLAARERMDREPGSIGTANMARDKLLSLKTQKKPIDRRQKTLVSAANRIINVEPLVGEVYNGEF
jgi:hypothetical protein